MIYAKINPVATTTKQINPFSATTLTADTITATARPYVLGADSVRFEVQYGTVTTDASNNVISFKPLLSNDIVLSASNLESWGTDDSVVFSVITATYGTTVTSILSGATSS